MFVISSKAFVREWTNKKMHKNTIASFIFGVACYSTVSKKTLKLHKMLKQCSSSRVSVNRKERLKIGVLDVVKRMMTNTRGNRLWGASTSSRTIGKSYTWTNKQSRSNQKWRETFDRRMLFIQCETIIIYNQLKVTWYVSRNRWGDGRVAMSKPACARVFSRQYRCNCWSECIQSTRQIYWWAFLRTEKSISKISIAIVSLLRTLLGGETQVHKAIRPNLPTNALRSVFLSVGAQ